MTGLNGKQLSFLRAHAHHLNPVVQIGKSGITEAVVRQIEEQLRAHELIKVRFAQEAPVSARASAAALAQASDSTLVQCAGRTVTLYRRHDHRPKLELPGMRLRREVVDSQRRDPRLSLRRKHSKARQAERANEAAHERPRQTIDRLRTPEK